MLRDLLSQSWAIRKQNFPDAVEMSYPKKTLSVSLTGQGCGLKCAHCGGHYLTNMVSMDQVRSRAQTLGTRSLLISGGCGPTGKVPFMPFLKELESLKNVFKLNFHVGLVDDEEAAAVASLAAAVSFDFVGDNETIREVYGLPSTVDDYVRSYLALRRYAPVLPHICIGLRGGRLSGERKALQILKDLGTDALVFIVLIPTPGTTYADVSPPSPLDVATLIAEARIDFPTLPVLLGCMRPGGRHRAATDILSLKAGVNKIVNPAPRALRTARRLGLEVLKGEECCVL